MRADKSPPTRRRPFQFGIVSILILTTIGALVIGIGRAIDAPLVWQLGISGYVFCLLIYGFLRIPYLLRISFGKGSQWEEVQQKRKELEASVKRDDDSTTVIGPTPEE